MFSTSHIAAQVPVSTPTLPLPRSSQPEPARICVVENDAFRCTSLVSWLKRAGHDVVTFASATRARRHFEEWLLCDIPTQRIHLLVCGPELPFLSGSELLSYLRTMSSELPAVLLTSAVAPGPSPSVHAASLGAVVLPATAGEADLLAAVAGALQSERAAA